MKQIALIMAASAILASADELKITEVDYFGPVPQPVWLDVSYKAPEAKNLIEMPVNPSRDQYVKTTLSQIPSVSGLQIVAFDIENRDFTKAEIQVDGVEAFECFLDGKKYEKEVALRPGTHRVVVKYAADTAPSITVKSSKEGAVKQVTDGTRMYTLEDVMFGTQITGAQLSPSGAWLLASYAETDADGKVAAYQKLFDVRTGAPDQRLSESASWMPKSDKYYFTRKGYGVGRQLVAVNPADGSEQVLAINLPEGDITFSPTEDFIVIDMVREGRKENPKAYQVLEPEDRIPGWRDRHYPAIMKLDGKNVAQPLGAGKNNLNLQDISSDGSKLLLLTNRSRYEKRPTQVFSLIVVDVNTLSADTIVKDDGFISQGWFSPDGSQVLVKGTPEAFGRIGCTLPEDKIPSMTENELFIVSLSDKSVLPITRDLDPSIEDAAWSKQDGKVYARVEERDIYTVYQIDPKTGAYKLIPMSENIVKGFALTPGASSIAWWGQSDSNPDGLYVTNLKSGKTMDLDHPSAERLKDVRLGKFQEWQFTNRKGDTVYGCYYLPDNFDPNKTYPLIVNYYGGCSPSQRLFESRYPKHVYTELGYVVLVLQPSGATGFGQEWASRHVNTAGQGPAEDIIDGLDRFLEEHPFVDGSKVGCIGASYGGFMTMYLQSITDKFACAISHAGISDHTSYWGEGYWGYSYSEVSMAESYPWSHPDLYVKQSPLFRADKMHTPLLLLHGDGDTNVPPGESIQMFAALNLLGCPTALVEIEKQDHHIKDVEKRQLWQDTIFAWFAKYLKDDSSWWDYMYPGLE